MNNMDIINAAKAANNINEEVHTYVGWKNRGHVVRKGEHALFKTKIWLMTKENVEVEEGVFEWCDRFVMTQAAFFGESQVTKLSKR